VLACHQLEGGRQFPSSAFDQPVRVHRYLTDEYVDTKSDENNASLVPYC
jgi:hypothetical protein